MAKEMLVNRDKVPTVPTAPAPTAPAPTAPAPLDESRVRAECLAALAHPSPVVPRFGRGPR